MVFDAFLLIRELEMACKVVPCFRAQFLQFLHKEVNGRPTSLFWLPFYRCLGISRCLPGGGFRVATQGFTSVFQKKTPERSNYNHKPPEP